MDVNKITDARSLTLQVTTVQSDIVLVSPAVALDWLETMVTNRPISKSMVMRYASDMANGLWTFAADPIRFDFHGRLVDGQHRLKAVARQEPGTRIAFMVVRGLPPESQQVMDQGRKRTAGQQLALAGHRNASFVAASARVIMMWDQDLLFANTYWTNQITTPMVAEWVESHPDLVEFLHTHVTKLKRTGATYAASGGFALAAARRDAEVAELFFTQLDELANLPTGSPILVLKRRLERIRNEGFITATYDYLALFIQAWNAWIDGATVSKFQRPKNGGWSPENFPVMK